MNGPHRNPTRQTSGRTSLSLAVCAGALLALSAGLLPVRAASHSDAPLIKQDPQANLTDVYSFIGNNRFGVKVLNVIVHVRPFSEPGDGVLYDRFADDALYSIHIANPATGRSAIRYDYRFSPVASGYKNLDTILSYGRGTEVGPIEDIGDARQNFTQTYQIRRVVGNNSTALASGLMVPPPNVGKNTTPRYNDAMGIPVSGAAMYADLDKYTQQGTYDLAGGEIVFAGPREDGFYADIPAIFDLLDIRILDNDGDLGDGLGQDGNGVDGFKGFNVLAYAIQIPVSQLEDVPGFPQVGVYASVSRRQVRILNNNGDRVFAGPWVQVNRMGNPLFNEALVATADKDRYNRTSPTSDTASFSKYALNPEVAALINFVYSTSFATTGRTDLVGIFIPDVLRVNTSTEPVRLAGEAGFSRLSFIGGDTTLGGAPSGWPNGRRLGDDVIDIALTAVASGPSYAVITMVGDNAAANDQLFHRVFPYSATPHAGPTNKKDSP